MLVSVQVTLYRGCILREVLNAPMSLERIPPHGYKITANDEWEVATAILGVLSSLVLLEISR